MINRNLFLTVALELDRSCHSFIHCLIFIHLCYSFFVHMQEDCKVCNPRVSSRNSVKDFSHHTSDYSDDNVTN